MAKKNAKKTAKNGKKNGNGKKAPKAKNGNGKNGKGSKKPKKPVKTDAEKAKERQERLDAMFPLLGIPMGFNICIDKHDKRVKHPDTRTHHRKARDLVDNDEFQAKIVKFLKKEGFEGASDFNYATPLELPPIKSN